MPTGFGRIWPEQSSRQFVEGAAAVDPQSQASVEEVRAHVIGAISKLELEEQGRLVATFYFYERLTLKQIRHALTKLRKYLKGSPLALGGCGRTSVKQNFG